MIETFLFRDSKLKLPNMFENMFMMSQVKVQIILVREYIKDSLKLAFKIRKSRPSLLYDDKSNSF